MEMPPHTKAYLERPTLVELSRRPIDDTLRPFRNTLRTFADARRLFDAVHERLGDRAVVERENGPQRTLHLRDPERPEYLLTPPLIDERSWGAIGEPDPPADRIVPKGPDMHAGEMDLHDGEGRVRFVFDVQGMLRGVAELGGDPGVIGWQAATRGFTIDRGARPPTPPIFSLFLRGDLGDELSIDTLANWLVELAVRREHTPRVAGASELPCCTNGALMRVRNSISNRLWADPPGPDDRWLALDGAWGRAQGIGPTPDAALAQLERNVWAGGAPLLDPEAGALPFDLSAWLPESTEPPDNLIHLPTPPAEDTTVIPVMERMTFSFGPFISRHDWPTSIDRLPSVLVPIPPRPITPAPLADAGFEPLAVAGPTGAVRWVFRRLGRDPLIVIGGGVADLFDDGLVNIATLEQDMREADQRDREFTGAELDLMTYPGPWTTHYSVWESRSQRATRPERAGGQSGGFAPDVLNTSHFDVQLTRVTARPMAG